MNMLWNAIRITYIAMLLPLVFCRGQRLVAIGDLHGDIENTREILRLAQIVDADGHWASGTDTVIQMGDVVDRGPHGHTIMNLLRRLSLEATLAGGELIQLLGNHELMNFQGDAKFVSPEHLAAFGGLKGWKDAWSSASGPFGAQIVQRPVVAIRNHSLFVHAGITAQVASQGPVRSLNDKIHELLISRRFNHPLLLDGGPVWTRTIIYAAQRGDCEPLYSALQEINRQERISGSTDEIRRMIVGHTIQPNGAIRAFCNNSLFAIDVCISQYMQTGGHLAHLELRPLATGESVGLQYPSIPDAKHRLHMPEKFLSNEVIPAGPPELQHSSAPVTISIKSHSEWEVVIACAVITALVACGLRWVFVQRKGMRRILASVRVGRPLSHDRSV